MTTSCCLSETDPLTLPVRVVRLRAQWRVRLENRTKHLKNLNDSYVRKVKTEKTAVLT